jgi:quercetin dioxygenase-like cupin family protein
MSVVHRFTGVAFALDWEGATYREYNGPGVKGASGKILIGPADGAANFVFRYFRVDPGGNTVLEHHPHDHGVLILHGRARVRLGEQEFEVGPQDLVYVSPNDVHQFHTLGDEPLGFLCVIPPKDKRPASADRAVITAPAP